MTRIAIYGASEDDQVFFKEALGSASARLDFYNIPLDASTIDCDIEILSVFVDAPLTAEVLRALPKVKLIACRSTGVNNVDLQTAKQRGITVANVPAYGGATVAEYAFTLLLMLTRHMPEVLNESVSVSPDRVRERGTDLFGKTLGVIGTGHIGLSTARIGRGFGMEVLGYDLYPRPQEARAIGFTYVKEVDELMAKSDVISLHVPYTPDNHHFLSREHLSNIKHGAIVINTARGELVDTTALVDALRHGHVGAAALDVLESEYLMEPDKLIALASHSDAARQTLSHAVSLAALQRMPNVIVTNHNAYNTVEAIQRINQTTAENILNFIAGKEVHTV